VQVNNITCVCLEATHNIWPLLTVIGYIMWGNPVERSDQSAGFVNSWRDDTASNFVHRAENFLGGALFYLLPPSFFAFAPMLTHRFFAPPNTPSADLFNK
jgi:hypothetical protein